MSTQLADRTIAPVDQQPAPVDADWDLLDITVVEGGPAADKLIVMTDDGCGQTCESACSTTCS